MVMFYILNELDLLVRPVWKRLVITPSLFVHSDLYLSPVWSMMTCNLLLISVFHLFWHIDDTNDWILITNLQMEFWKYTDYRLSRTSLAVRLLFSFHAQLYFYIFPSWKLSVMFATLRAQMDFYFRALNGLGYIHADLHTSYGKSVLIALFIDKPLS